MFGVALWGTKRAAIKDSTEMRQLMKSAILVSLHTYKDNILTLLWYLKIEK